jgi:hypothetical protein
MVLQLSRRQMLLFVVGEEADQQARKEKNQAADHPHEGLTDPEGHGEVESQD